MGTCATGASLARRRDGRLRRGRGRHSPHALSTTSRGADSTVVCARPPSMDPTASPSTTLSGLRAFERRWLIFERHADRLIDPCRQSTPDATRLRGPIEWRTAKREWLPLEHPRAPDHGPGSLRSGHLPRAVVVLAACSAVRTCMQAPSVRSALGPGLYVIAGASRGVMHSLT